MNYVGLEAKILVVCECNYGAYFKALLERAGFIVVLAENCEQAVLECAGTRFALVVIVHVSGDILVESFCNRLRQDDWHAHRPIAICIHGGNPALLATCYRYGVNEVLCSPMPGAEIVARLTALITSFNGVEAYFAERVAKLTDSLMRRHDKIVSELEKMISHRIYCETLYSVTNGHFVLLDYEEFDDYLNTMEPEQRFLPENSVAIKSTHDVDNAITMAEDVCDSFQTNYPDLRFDDWQKVKPDNEFDKDGGLDYAVICLSELACNIIKHGGGVGTLNINVNTNDWRLYSSDSGTGFNEMFLANALFMGGSSSRKSFGMGFTIFWELADYIIMATGEQGTRLVLIRSREHDIAQSSTKRMLEAAMTRVENYG